MAGVALLDVKSATFAGSSVANAFCLSYTSVVAGQGLVNATSSQRQYFIATLGGGGVADSSCPSDAILFPEAQDTIDGASFTIQNTNTRFSCGRNGFDCKVVAV